MADFIYPSNAELSEIAQDKLPALQADRKIFEIMPIEDHDTSTILWEQLDNYTGLQNLRGEGGSFPLIQHTGSKRYAERPGFYGEGEAIDEVQLTERRKLGTFGEPITISDLVMAIQDKLLQRRLDRIEWIGWQLLQYGQFAVSTATGVPAHQGAYAIQSYSATIGWGTPATATPLNDFRAVQLLARGHSVNIGREARAVMNRKTLNNLLQNTNAADLYGRRTAGLGTYNILPAINELLLGEDLPTIEVYDEGYLDDTGTFQPWIADNKVVVVGRRPAGQPVAKYIQTRNASHPSMAPGAYMFVTDQRGATGGGNAPSIGVYDSHNGGPIIQYPSAVVVMNV